MNLGSGLEDKPVVELEVRRRGCICSRRGHASSASCALLEVSYTARILRKLGFKPVSQTHARALRTVVSYEQHRTQEGAL
jgi:hypothetical protein